MCVWHTVLLIVALFSLKGHEPGFCMLCTMQNHIIQVFANSGNAIKPLGVLHELKREYTLPDT